MSNLASPFDAILAAAAKVKPSEATAERFRRVRVTGGERVLLLDCSGSMGEWVGAKRKIDILRSAIGQLDLSQYRIYAFSSGAEEVQPFAIPDPSGGTALHFAIGLAASQCNPQETLIVSDGMPDSKALALDAAARLPGVISTLFIGSDQDSEAIAFMRQLARLGCGRSHQDLSLGVERLAGAMKALGAGNG